MVFQEVNCDRSAKTIEIRINRLKGGLFSEEGELLSKWGEITSSDLKAMQEEVEKDRAAREKYAEMLENGKR
jgi:primosomal protein N''